MFSLVQTHRIISNEFAFDFRQRKPLHTRHDRETSFVASYEKRWTGSITLHSWPNARSLTWAHDPSQRTPARHARIREKTNRARALWNVVLFPFRNVYTDVVREICANGWPCEYGEKRQPSIALSAEVRYVWMQTIRCTASHHWMPSRRRLLAYGCEMWNVTRGKWHRSNSREQYLLSGDTCVGARTGWPVCSNDVWTERAHVLRLAIANTLSHKCILFTAFDSQRRLVHSDIRFILKHVLTVFLETPTGLASCIVSETMQWMWHVCADHIYVCSPPGLHTTCTV